MEATDLIHMLHRAMRTNNAMSTGVDPSTDSGGGSGSSFVRLHLDPTLLAEYESPNYDEAVAMPLDELPPTPIRCATGRHGDTSTTTTPLSASATAVVESVGWMLSTLRSPKGDMRCRYRKGKCSNPRTLKKNGNLHSYCELHRQRSVRNQRKFDQKKRESMQLHVCDDCMEGEDRGGRYEKEERQQQEGEDMVQQQEQWPHHESPIEKLPKPSSQRVAV